MRLLAFLMFLLPLSLYAEDDYCFYTNEEGSTNHDIYHHHIKAELRRLVVLVALKQIKPTSYFKSLKHNWRTNCLSLDASDDIRHFVNKLHVERRKLYKKITHPTGLNNCLHFVAGYKPPYKRILFKYPEKKDITMLDEFKQPIKINVLLVAEDVVQYTVNYRGKHYTFYRGLDSHIEVLPIPYFDESLKRTDENNKLLDPHKRVTLLNGELLYKDNDAFFAVNCPK